MNKDYKGFEYLIHKSPCVSETKMKKSILLDLKTKMYFTILLSERYNLISNQILVQYLSSIFKYSISGQILP